MDTMNMRIPPAMKNDPGWMPMKRRIALPVKMKTHRTAKATMTAFRMVRRFFRAGKSEVRAMKTGTTPNGSTTMKMARNIVTI